MSHIRVRSLFCVVFIPISFASLPAGIMLCMYRSTATNLEIVPLISKNLPKRCVEREWTNRSVVKINKLHRQNWQITNQQTVFRQPVAWKRRGVARNTNRKSKMTLVSWQNGRNIIGELNHLIWKMDIRHHCLWILVLQVTSFEFHDRLIENLNSFELKIKIWDMLGFWGHPRAFKSESASSHCERTEPARKWK